MTRNNDGIFGGGNGFIILILFLLMLSGNWGGFGGSNAYNGAMTRADMYEGLNTQDIQNSLNNLGTSMNNGFAGIQNSLCSGFGGIQSAIADSNYRMADCCCQIKTAIQNDGEQTRALITHNEIQKLRDALQDAKNETFATGLTTAQVIQTNTLENFIRQILSTTTTTTPTA